MSFKNKTDLSPENWESKNHIEEQKKKSSTSLREYFTQNLEHPSILDLNTDEELQKIGEEIDERDRQLKKDAKPDLEYLAKIYFR